MPTSTSCEIKLDALSEAGNIAAANAVSALSKIIDEKVKMDLTKCRYIKTEEIPYIFGEECEIVVAINMLIPTKNLCTVLMFLPVQSAIDYCDKFSKNKPGTTKNISYEQIVILTEIGNICICAYLNGLSKLLDIRYMPTPPAVACDTINSILEEVAVSADVVDNKAILIETDFSHDTGSYKCHFLFIPDRDSKNAIFDLFKVN